MDIQDLSIRNGLLPLNLGNAWLITSHSNLIHIIQLEKYEDNINQISDSLLTFENNTELIDSLEITKNKLKEASNNLFPLLPQRRTKRGLVNGLGTIIKSITGNLGANDAIKINNEIHKILSNENRLNIEKNQQSKLNRQMIDQFENIMNHINQQQQAITSYLIYVNENSRNQIRADHKNLKCAQYLNQINYNIDLLTEHLSGILEAILLAKLNIISKLILL